MEEDPIIVNVCKLYNHIQDASSDILNLYTIKCKSQLASEVSLHLQFWASFAAENYRYCGRGIQTE